jgi:hypothetical protein
MVVYRFNKLKILPVKRRIPVSDWAQRATTTICSLLYFLNRKELIWLEVIKPIATIAKIPTILLFRCLKKFHKNKRRTRNVGIQSRRGKGSG